MNTQPEYFATLYGSNDDPYSVRTRWYERRKRALLMAALPQARYRRAYEPGCGIGELTVDLARRCDQVVASDANLRAVELARDRLRGYANVRIEQQSLPLGWPPLTERFDLIVLSEVGYFLTADNWQAVAEHCRHSLDAGGTLVACDWRAEFEGRQQSTHDVHEALSSLGLHALVHHVDDDFELRVWSPDARSVAQREHIR